MRRLRPGLQGSCGNPALRFAGAAVFLALAVLGCLPAAGCHADPPRPAAARHLVLVTIDTLRADRLGVYGNRQVETPRLDRIAREGAMATAATAHVPLTRPSHVTLFTGRLPTETGVRDNVSPAVGPDVPLLAEVLKKSGFRSAGFISSVVLDASSGLDRGFDTYSAPFEGNAAEAQFLSTLQRKGDVTTSEAIAWLESVRHANAATPRLFLWLHLYDPHAPYDPPEPYATRYAERPYDGEVAFSDELVGRLDDALSRLGLRNETLLVLTSDHGEGLGEHGETLHGFFAYETTLHIPLIARGPGIPAGTRLASSIRLVDLFPTALDLLGVPSPANARLSGVSLAPALRDGKPMSDTIAYAESLVPLLHFGWSDLRVIRQGRWKYIQAPRPELYDLETDPGEINNLADEQRSRTAAMRSALGRFLNEEREAGANANAGSVPLDLVEKLGALGYVGGVAPAKTATPRADPKDRVEDFRIASDSIRQGLLLFHDKDYRGSVAQFEAVLRRGISNFEVHFYLARALSALGRWREAASHFAESARRLPAYAAAWEGLAESLVASGDTEAGRAALHRGQAELPNDAGLRRAEGRLLWELGRNAEARGAYEASLRLAPKNAAARAELGELLREMGLVDEAIQRQREAVELAPATASYWNSLGMTLGGNGRMAEAEKAFREAWRLDDRDQRCAYNLGLILLRQQRPAEARVFLEKALALDPRFAPARERLTELARSVRK
jgi:arylsulfatase A-like enzyme/Flp pilus assembly protein TadD